MKKSVRMILAALCVYLGLLLLLLRRISFGKKKKS